MPENESAKQTGNSSLRPLRSHHFSAILPAVDGCENWPPDRLASELRALVSQSGLTAVADARARFQPEGASAVVVLAESHVAVHLWPEYSAATVDIHVCDFGQDNEARALRLAELIGLRLSGEPASQLWSRLTVEMPASRPGGPAVLATAPAKDGAR